MKVFAGVDIGGTKCAVCLGNPGAEDSVASVRSGVHSHPLEIIGRRQFATLPSPEANVRQLLDSLDALLAEQHGAVLQSIGISCGGPLDSRRGLILTPPNLPNWDRVDVVTPFRQRFGVPVGLQNDANACALAEWLWGAGRGCHNMVFLTFGTGMGAGLILNGQLYAGANDMAGEVGHVRLENDGPVGYDKAGSFEGFCSGGGIAQLGRTLAAARVLAGEPPLYCPTMAHLPAVTAQNVGEAAQQGDATALEVFEIVAHKLGRGLAMLVDILNPERIVIGSIWGRQRALLEQLTLTVLRQEALADALAVCEIVPAGLGEQVGDFASLSVAVNEHSRVRSHDLSASY
jgi:glucokinase